MSETSDRLRRVLRAVCEDALFATLASGPRAIEGITKRRQPVYDALAKGDTHVVTLADLGTLDAWLATLVAAAAPVICPWFVPLRDALDDGLIGEHAPRGLRKVLGGHASAERLKRDGTFAVRVVRAVSNGDGVISPDEQRAIDLLIAALGLADVDKRLLVAEAPIPIASLEAPEDLEFNLARAIVRGACEAAATDGLEPSELAAAFEVAARLRVPRDAVEDARTLGERTAVSQTAIGHAAVDAVRYVVAILDEPQVHPLVVATAHLTIPARRRAEVLRAIEARITTPLAQDHRSLEKAGRITVLAAAWSAALAVDPSATLRARLLARHDRLAIDLGAERQAKEAREVVDETLERVLERGVAATGA